MTNEARTLFSGTTAADETLLRMVESQAAWVATAVSTTDPQGWLFRERARYQRDGQCDPWAENMLRRVGMFPMAS